MRTRRPSRRPLRLEGLEDRLAPALTVSASPSTFLETAGANAATGTVTRSGDLTQPLAVNLFSSDTTEVTVPASVTIPAGLASATFPLAALDDPARDGPEAVGISAVARVDGGTGPLASLVSQGVITTHVPTHVAALPDGKWIVVGYTRYTGTTNAYDVFVSRLLADGSPDLTFGPADGTVRTDINGRSEQAYGVIIQSDGKILVLAYGDVYPNSTYDDIILLRYSADGVLDPTFGNNGVALQTTGRTVLFNWEPTDFVVQPDGKIVVIGTGQSNPFNSTDFNVARFNANGTMDTGFGTNGYRLVDYGGLEDTYGVALQSDGKIVVVGNGGASDFQLMARYTPDGALDATFGTGGFLAVDQQYGREHMAAVVIDAQDRIITYGGGQWPSGDYTMFLSRYLPDGTLDTSFAGGGYYIGYNLYTGGTTNGLIQLADGRLVATVTGNRFYAGVAVFSADGALMGHALDTNTFVGNGTIAVSPTGVVAGVVENYASRRGYMNRYQLAPATAVDVAATQVTVTDNEPIFLGLTINPTTFPEAGGPAAATATLTRSDGYTHETYTVTLTSSDTTEVTVPASVTFAVGQTTLTFAVAVVDDSQFDGTQTVTVTASAPNAIGGTVSSVVTLSVLDDEPPPGTPALTLTLSGPFPEHAGTAAATGTVTRTGGDLAQPLTVTLAGGDATELTLPASVTIPANQTSVTFPLNAIDDPLIDGDQSVAVTASLTGTAITGTITYQNTYFGTSGSTAAAVAVTGTGRVLVAGNQGNDIVVRRYMPDMTADYSWGSSGAAHVAFSGSLDRVEEMWLYPDGRVLVLGTVPNGTYDMVLARFTMNGVLDPTFGTGGKLILHLHPGAGIAQQALDVAVGLDGKIVVVATIDRGAPTGLDLAVVRLNADGTRDTGFGTNGVAVIDFAGGADRGFAVAVLPDGRVVAAGEAAGTGSLFGVVRLTTTGTLDPTFGTGGKVTIDLPGYAEAATDVLLRADGRILAVGRVGRDGPVPTVYDAGLVQLNPDGTLDTSFGVSGVRVQADYNGTSVVGPVKAVLQADGRVLVAATAGASRPNARGRLMRFSVSGTQENAVSGPGSFIPAVIEDLAILPNGEIYLAFDYGNTGGFTGYVDKYRTAPSTGTLTATTVSAQVLDNEPFFPRADAYTAAEDGTLTVPAASGVLANDVLTRPIAPTVSVWTFPVFGLVTLNADGSFSYTPRPDFAGQDSFTYWISDGVAVSAQTIVRITVAPTNDAPAAAADSYTLDEDGPPLTVAATPPPGTDPSLTVRYNFDEGVVGSGPAYDLGPAPADNGRFVNGAGRAGSVGANGSRGAAAFGQSGSLLTAGDVNAIDAATSLTVSFWLNLRGNPRDGDVLIEDMPPSFPIPPQGTWGWRLITTAAPGQTPTAASFRAALSVSMSAGSSGSLATIPLQTNLSADGRWLFLAFTLQNGTQGSEGSYFVGSEAAAVTNPQGAQFTSLFIGGGNDAPLTVGGTTAPGENRTPPAWIDDLRVYTRALTLAELETIRQATAPPPVLGVLANDGDPDGDALTAELVSGPANGSLTLNPDGSFAYTPNPNFSGTDTFTYRAFDGTAYTPAATVSLVVRAQPDLVGTVQVNDGAAQRSKVTDLTLTFDAELDAALLNQPGAFTLTRTDGATVGTITAAATVAGGQTTIVLSFSGANTEFGSLTDGRWTLSVNRNFIRSTGGLNLAADQTAALHRLYGDVNGDAAVNGFDYSRFRAAYGSTAGSVAYRADLDFNADGAINGFDYSRFRTRYGVVLP
ncbi:MAG TPA: tandem-95 repeat protein [Gemmataceae bacterium]|nr:tandem-95 repeat protein [Gemmataceae bacterium]